MSGNRPVPSKDIDVLKYQKSLVDFMKTYPQFTDWDFEGSNFSVLMRLLALNAYNMAHYDNMVGNEAWVDTAELRQSQVSHATDLNYLPRSRISSQSILEVEVFPADTPSSIILPKYYRFKTSDNNGRTIYFLTDQDYTTNVDANGRYIFRNVNVYQGEIVDEFFDVEGVRVEGRFTVYDEPFVIASSNIDINSIEVFVGASAGDPNPTRYTRAKTLAETTSTSTTYFIRGIYDDQYAVEFGDGTFGAPLSNGNRVQVRYRDTLGPIIQGNYVFTRTTDISGYSDISINSATRVQGGFERESIEEIRQNSPKHFQTQDRAVTDTDYENIIKESFPQIQRVSVFGGEEVQQYGKIMIVLKPYGTTGIVSNAVKSQIISLLKQKNIVPEPIIINPDYYYIGITGNVFYSGEAVKITVDQLKTNITKNLIELNNGALGDFKINVYQSLITDTIDQSDLSITGSDVAMDLRKRWNPALNLNETLSFTSNNPFYKSRDGAFQSPNDYTLTSSPFTIFYNGVQQNVIIQDDGIGNIYYFSIDASGNKIRIGQSIGTVDYENGAVKLVANILQYGNYIEIICRLRNKTITIVRDSFAIVDGPDIDLTLKRQ